VVTSRPVGFPPMISLVPHRPPMLLLDHVCLAEETKVACEVTLHDDSPFVEHHRVRGAIALEYMAQCVGAFAGLRALARGEPIPVGYLVGAREVVFEIDHFEVGDALRVEVDHVFGDTQLGHFMCRVLRGGRAVASAALHVVQRGSEAG
jgi:predicted hotdog family 3-hydroxylacyl-ACP dehydratase